jgi:dephospho-CoA kinase
MIKVGLSGNRYSGTNQICDVFRKLTIPVFEADIILKFIINHDITVSSDIRSKLKHLHNNSGYIDPRLIKTKKEAEIVLESAQHELMSAYDKFSEKNKSSIYTIFHSSVLFEKEWHKLMNHNIAVFCPKITRMERCRELTKNKISDIAYLMRTEIDDLDKNKMANFVVHNYDGRNVLDQVHQIDQFVIDSYLSLEQSIVSKHY